MNHPSCEEWVAYLYKELNGAQRATLTAHLAECPACRQQVEDWRVTRRQLDRWQIVPADARPLPSRQWYPALRWAVTALLLITAGFAFARMTGPADVDVAALRVELRDELIEAIREPMESSAAATLATANNQTRELFEEFALGYQADRAADHAVILTALQELESRRATDFVSLRKDLETVAVHSDFEFRRTQQDLIRLADFTIPSPLPSNP
jgi:hypothetical protein